MKQTKMTKSKKPTLAATFKLLSDPTRLAIFDLLMQGVQCNCEIGEQLGLGMNLISHHLKALRQAGLVNVERDALDARWMYYSVNREKLAELNDQLTAFLAPHRIQPRLPTCGPRLVPVAHPHAGVLLNSARADVR